MGFECINKQAFSMQNLTLELKGDHWEYKRKLI